MGYLKYVRELWNKKNDDFSKLNSERKIAWKNEPATIRIDYSTRPDRARSLGYKAKQGFILVRQRLSRGGHQRPFQSGGRKSSNQGSRLTLSKNYQQIAEERAIASFPNCEVLNSYFVAADGKHGWYEIIMLDKDHPQIATNRETSWVYRVSGRAQRGLTSAAKKSRGLRRKGMGAENARPSKRSNRI